MIKKIKETFPSIKETGIRHWDIPNKSLMGSGGERFNASLIEWKGETLMSYRAYSPEHGRTVIAISTLDENWKPTDKCILELPGKGSKQICEDARLFAYKDDLYCSYTEIDHSVNPAWHATQRLVRLDENFKVAKYIPMTFGRNKDYAGIEKNWVFFDGGDGLCFVYDIRTMHVCQVHEKSGTVKKQWQDKEIFYEHGILRGGTSPTEYGEEMIAFYHTSTDFPWLERRYGMGTYTFKKGQPYSMNRISKEPLLMGSRNNDFCGSGNGKCIFPCGHIYRDGVFYVACGVNDTYCTILAFTKDEIESNLTPACDFHERPIRYFLSNKQGSIAGTHKDYRWELLRVGKIRESVIRLDDMKALSAMKEDPDAVEITEEEYNMHLTRIGKQPKQDDRQGNLHQASLTIEELRRNGQIIG